MPGSRVHTPEWYELAAICQVVAAELNSEGSKDIVIYKIRVADSTGEWTVSRRFRNFESLQRTLKELPSYKIKMPAKRVFSHSQNVEFVEERRQQLDHYLQQILGDATLTGKFSQIPVDQSCSYLIDQCSGALHQNGVQYFILCTPKGSVCNEAKIRPKCI